MMDAAGLRSVSAIRNRALVALIACGGLRVSTALSVRPGDLALDRDRIRIGVEGDPREVELIDRGPEEIARWLEERRGLGLPDDAPLLCTLRGRPLATSYVRELLPRLAARAGIAGAVSGESLRRAHTAELVRLGWSLRRVQMQLGHGAAATTRRFLSRVERGATAAPPARPSPEEPAASAPTLRPDDLVALLAARVQADAGPAVLFDVVRADDGALANLRVRAIEAAPEHAPLLDLILGAGAAPGLRLSESVLPGLDAIELIDACGQALRTGRVRRHECAIAADGEAEQVSMILVPVGADAVVMLASAHAPAAPPDDWAAVGAALWDDPDVLRLVLDADMRVVRASPAACAALGARGDALAGRRPPFDFLPNLDAAALRALAGASQVETTVLGRGQASLLPIGVRRLGPPSAERGCSPPAECGYLLSICGGPGAARAERELRDALTAYRGIAEHSPEHVARFDRTGRLLYANARLAADLLEPGTGSSRFGSAQLPQGLDALWQGLSAVVATGEPRTCEIEVSTSAGPGRFEWLLGPERAPDGSISHVVGFGRDMTARHRALVELRRRLVVNTILAEVTLMAADAPDRALALLCRGVARIMSAGLVVIVAVDGGSVGAVAAIWPPAEWDAISGAQWRRVASACLADAALGQVRVVGLGDARAEGINGELLRARGHDHLVVAPVTVSGSPWGAILVATGADAALAGDAEATVSRLSQAAAAAIRSARLRRRAGAQAALSRLVLAEGADDADAAEAARTALAKEGADLFGAQCGMVIESVQEGAARVVARWVRSPMDPPAQVGDRFARDGRCAAALALRRGDAVVIDDVRGVDDEQARRLAGAGFRSALAAPLAIGGARRGALCVASVQAGAFDEHARATFGEFTRLAGRWLERDAARR